MSRVGENIKKARLASGLSEKALGKKLGVSEGYIVEVEQGRKVINEGMIVKFSKVLGKNVSDLGLGSFEAEVVLEEREKERQTRIKKPQIPQTTAKKEAKPASDIWSQAFGENLKDIPVYDESMAKAIEKRMYPVEKGKIKGYNMDKVVLIKSSTDELQGFLIGKDSLLMGVPVKEINEEAIYLIEVDGKNQIRKVKNLGNGNCLAITKRERETSVTIPLKEIKPLIRFFSVENML